MPELVCFLLDLRSLHEFVKGFQWNTNFAPDSQNIRKSGLMHEVIAYKRHGKSVSCCCLIWRNIKYLNLIRGNKSCFIKFNRIVHDWSASCPSRQHSRKTNRLKETGSYCYSKPCLFCWVCYSPCKTITSFYQPQQRLG